MATLYDTHVHLSDPEYRGYVGSVLACMERAGVAACCVSTDPADSAETARLGRHRSVLPFVGVHPEKAAADPGPVEEMVAADPGSFAGIGEVGLDPSFGDPGRQRRVFERMLQLAERHGKPVSVHSRRCADEAMSVLGSFSVTACLHWFDGNRRQLRRAMDAGLYVSYGPVMVYAADKRALLARTDRDRILVETDGPVRFSRCFGRVPAQPAHVASVVLAAARALGTGYGEAAALAAANAERFLGVFR